MKIHLHTTAGRLLDAALLLTLGVGVAGGLAFVVMLAMAVVR